MESKFLNLLGLIALPVLLLAPLSVRAEVPAILGFTPASVVGLVGIHAPNFVHNAEIHYQVKHFVVGVVADRRLSDFQKREKLLPIVAWARAELNKETELPGFVYNHFSSKIDQFEKLINQDVGNSPNHYEDALESIRGELAFIDSTHFVLKELGAVKTGASK